MARVLLLCRCLGQALPTLSKNEESALLGVSKSEMVYAVGPKCYMRPKEFGAEYKKVTLEAVLLFG
jgi:hypothetical protein